MSEDQYQLHYVGSQIKWAQKQMAELEAKGLLDKLPTYGTRTNRERYELEIKKYEQLQSDLLGKIRYNRVMTRWHMRKLNRPTPRKRPEQKPNWVSLDWFLPMGIDDVIQDRRIVDQG